jgi:hypothetical protein
MLRDTQSTFLTELPEGATITPVIIVSDETQLFQFRGDKVSYLVYLTLGNVKKDVHCQPNQRATALLGYLPVSKLECFQKGNSANSMEEPKAQPVPLL